MRKPVPQATSSVRAGGSAASATPSASTSCSQPGPLALREAAGAAVPLVVLGRAPVVVRLHVPRLRAVPRPLEPSRTSPRGATGRRSTRSRRPWLGRCAAARRARRRGPQPLGLHACRLGRELVESLAAAIARAAELIDLRSTKARIRGSGPPTSCRSCRWPRTRSARASRGRARRSDGRARPAGLPLRRAQRRPLAGVLRAGGPPDLQRRIDAGELTPEHGPPRLDPTRPARCSSASAPRCRLQRQPARRRSRSPADRPLVRETGGGFPGVRALGLDLPGPGSRRSP